MPSAADYESAAAAAGASFWDRSANQGPVCHVLLRLENDRSVLTVELPAQLPLTSAEAWLQSLVVRLGWSDARLYSYQSGRELRVAARERGHSMPVGPFRRRTTLNLEQLQAQLETLGPARVLLAVRTVDAALISAEPPPTVRTTRKNETYLFYSALPRGPATLAVTYGLTSRQIIAVSLASLLWLLFPVVVLSIQRQQLTEPSGKSEEERHQVYANWQRGVRIAGLAGAFLSFVALSYTGVVPRFFSPRLSLLFSLWWWHGAVGKLIILPEPSGQTRGAGSFLRLLSAAGDLCLAVLAALFVLVPFTTTRSTLMQLVDLIPLAVGAGGALVWLGSSWMLLRIKRTTSAARGAAPPVAELPDDPAAVRELLARLTTEIAAEEAAPAPDLPAATPQFAARYALAMRSALQSLDLDQRAALKASDQLASSGKPVPSQSPLSIVGSFAPLAVAGIAAWLVPHSARWLVLLTGVGLTWAFTAVFSRSAASNLNVLQQRLEDADFRVASAMDNPSRFLDALRQLAECDRLHRPKRETNAYVPSIYEERHGRLTRRLGLD